MAGVWMDAGLTEEVSAIETEINSVGWTVHLYTNAHTPATTDVLGDYTEATFGGYASQPFYPPVDGGVVANHVDITSNPLSFAATGAGLPQTVIGYYITDSGGTILKAAEEFPSPITFTNAGDTLAGTVIETLSRV